MMELTGMADLTESNAEEYAQSINYYGWMHNGGNAKGWISAGAWVTP